LSFAPAGAAGDLTLFSEGIDMSKIRDDKEVLDEFIRAHTYPAEDGLLVKQLVNHPVHARSDRGNAAAYFGFSDLKALEAHVSELPAAGSTTLHRHTCEALFYVLTGEGYTVIYDYGGTERRIEWTKGDLFFTPILVWHQHANTSANSVARYLEITTIPLMKSLGVWFVESKPHEEP
jgi:mannose-6-phosphate isomerase-like protein (cupin superfamily)